MKNYMTKREKSDLGFLKRCRTSLYRDGFFHESILDKNVVYKMIFSDGTFYIGKTTMPLGSRIGAHIDNALYKHDKQPIKARIKLAFNNNQIIEVEKISQHNNEITLSKNEIKLIKKHRGNPLCLNIIGNKK